MSRDSQVENVPSQRRIVWIGKETNFTATVCQWTVQWCRTHGVNLAAIARIEGLELAISSLQEPLALGQPPDLVVVDRSLQAVGIREFSTMVSDCLPECWIVELVTSKDTIPPEGTVVYLQRPFKKQDWLDLMQHCFIECPNPLWSRAAEEYPGGQWPH